MGFPLGRLPVQELSPAGTQFINMPGGMLPTTLLR